METTFAETTRLVSQAQSGNQEACELLFERYRPRVQVMVAMRLGRRLGDLESVEDLVQETLLQAFRGLERFEHRSVGSFRHWLAGLAVNRIRDEARMRGATKRGSGKVRPFSELESRVLTESVFAGRTPTPESFAVGHELADRIEQALLELAERDRQVIELRRVAELSFAEMATVLELGSEAAARAQFARSLRRLSEKLGDRLETEDA